MYTDTVILHPEEVEEARAGSAPLAEAVVALAADAYRDDYPFARIVSTTAAIMDPVPESTLDAHVEALGRVGERGAIFPVCAPEDTSLAKTTVKVPLTDLELSEIHRGRTETVAHRALADAGPHATSAEILTAPLFGEFTGERTEAFYRIKYDAIVVAGSERVVGSFATPLEAEERALEAGRIDPGATAVHVRPRAACVNADGEEVREVFTATREAPEGAAATVEVTVAHAKPGATIDHYVVVLGVEAG